MKIRILSLSLLFILPLISFTPAPTETETYYGYSLWAGHNKKLFISNVYSFQADIQGNYTETYIRERDNAFLRHLEVNYSDNENHNSQDRKSRQFKSKSEALKDRDETIIFWKGQGYSVTTVDFSWSNEE